MYELLKKAFQTKQFGPLVTHCQDRRYPAILAAPEGEALTPAVFVENLRKTLRDERDVLDKSFQDYHRLVGLQAEAKAAKETLSSAVLKALTPALLRLMSERQAPALLNKDFLQNFLQSIDAPEEDMASLESTRAAIQAEEDKLDALCQAINKQTGISNKNFLDNLKQFMMACRNIPELNKLVEKVNQRAEEEEAEENDPVKNRAIALAKSLKNPANSALWQTITNLSEDDIQAIQTAQTGILREPKTETRPADARFDHDMFADILLKPLVLKKFLAGVDQMAGVSAQATGLGIEPFDPGETTGWEKVQIETAIAFDRHADQFATAIETKLTEQTAKLQTSLQRIINLFMPNKIEIGAEQAPVAVIEMLLSSASNTARTGWPNAAIQLDSATLSSETSGPIRRAVLAFLTAAHNSIGHLANQYFCSGKTMSLAFATLSCREQAELSRNDSMIVHEARLRPLLYQFIANSGETKATKTKAADLLANLKPPKDASPAERLKRQHEQGLWHQYLEALEDDNKEAVRKKLFQLDLLLGHDNKRKTATPFLGLNMLQLRLGHMACSTDALDALFKFLNTKDTLSPQARITNWLDRIKGAATTREDLFAAADTSEDTYVTNCEIKLMQTLHEINKSFNDHGQLIALGLLPDQLNSLHNIALEHHSDMDGLTRLVAIHAASTWLDVFFRLTITPGGYLLTDNLSNDLRQLTKMTHSRFSKPTLKQPYLPVRQKLAQLAFMLEGDSLAENGDEYAWRRAELTERFQAQYESFLNSMVEKPSELRTKEALAEKLVVVSDLSTFCDKHSKPCPTFSSLAPNVIELAKKLSSYAEQFENEMKRDGHVNKTKAAFEADETISEHRDAIKLALDAMLSQKTNIALNGAFAAAMAEHRL